MRLLREELQVLQEPGSYVGEVVKVMGKKKVLVKVQPEGKYGTYTALCHQCASTGHTELTFHLHSGRLFRIDPTFCPYA